MARTLGALNKNKRGLKYTLKQAYGDEFDVIMMMAKNCVTLHNIAMAHCEGAVTLGEDVEAGNPKLINATSSAKIAIDALEKLAQYVEPKLKAVEVTGPEGGPIDLKWTIEITEAKKAD